MTEVGGRGERSLEYRAGTAVCIDGKQEMPVQIVNAGEQGQQYHDDDNRPENLAAAGD
ncbi:hypothetical protein D3C76_993170 [compost metagenome]